MIKKVTVCFLLAAFLVNASGYVNVYHFMLGKNSTAHQSYLQSRNHIAITTEQGLAGLINKGFEQKDEAEYVYKGRWYDVVAIEQKDGATIIHLAHDSYEEELLSFLKSFFQSSTRQNNKRETRLRHDMLKQYLPAIKKACSIFPDITPLNGPNIFKVSNRPFLEVLLPPPRAQA